MPRDLLRQLFDERDKARGKTLQGETLTPFTFLPFDNQGVLMHVADVKVSNFVLSAVPLSPNNRHLQYAQPGTPVVLGRSATGRVEITGLSKRGNDETRVYVITPPVLTPDASGTTSALTGTAVSLYAVSALRLSRATLGELATVTDGGFGETPLLAFVIRNADGDVVTVV